MVAGDKLSHLNKLDSLKCDVAMINLEDGVFDKQAALKLVYDKFKDQKLQYKNKQTVIRVNPLNSTGKKEIKLLNKLKPNGIRVSKINTKKDVKKALDLIDEDIELHLSIETAQGFKNLTKLKIDKRVTTVYLGILDLLESLGLSQELLKQDNNMIDYILTKFLLDSKIAGFKAVSFTYQQYQNTKEFSNWCKKVKHIGYDAKSCISPAQVDIINNIFAPDKKEIKKAKYIKKVFEKNQKNGTTGFSDKKYGFIDEPIYKDAIRVLDK
jgi:citrate lyase subunit beta/citryl-CoA lyase